ncbi:hypothetical protein E4U48_006196 [Claviceps purpurea]|nr:hypothetical protein E4U37_004194 [Claviceps purpurea]KAG6251839.1 hypothetical protein E4U23_000243 [Claviceps purpurea]KAG6271624.1 hypothetical protein E4U49_003637 [Claviceps purpurea]KAG6281748.1 hypothetical protein E4U48_006196 [Claviceps purpurea]
MPQLIGFPPSRSSRPAKEKNPKSKVSHHGTNEMKSLPARSCAVFLWSQVARKKRRTTKNSGVHGKRIWVQVQNVKRKVSMPGRLSDAACKEMDEH